MRSRSFITLALFSLVILITGCSKEEVALPMDDGAATDGIKCGSDSTGIGSSTPSTSDPMNGGISDDGDDQGDNEGPRKKKAKS